MTGQVQLSSLRVTAEMDSSNFVQGADAIEAANKRMADSGKDAGAVLAQQDAAAGRSGGTLTSLSRQYVTGYTENAKFTQQVGQLQTQMELGNASASRASTIYTGMVSKFGLVADAAAIAAGGNREFAAVIDAVNAKAVTQVASMGAAKVATAGLSEATALGSTQSMALFAALRHMFDATAAGIPLTRVLAMEAGNLSYGLSSAGGVAGSVQAVFSKIGEFVTPFRLVAGGAVAIGAGAVYAASSWSSAERDIEKALIGIGKTSGATVDDVNRISASSALATNTSFANAQAGATELLKTGVVYQQTFGELNTLTDKFAEATGTTTVEAAKKLGAAFADPVKGAETLNKEYGFLNASTLEQIRTYQALGDSQNAQLTLMRAFEPTIDKLIEKSGGLSVSWKSFKNLASDLTSATGSFLSGGTDQQQLATLKSQKQQLQNQGTAPVPGSVGTFALPDPGALDAVIAKIAELEKKIKAASDESAAAQLDKLGLQADAVTRSVLGEIGQLEKLEAAYNVLARAQEAGVGNNDTDAAARAIQVQKALIIESADAADRHNQIVSEIAVSYTGVGVQTALVLDAQKQSLAVAQAQTMQEKLTAEETARRYQLEVTQGKSAPEAASIAAGERRDKEAQIDTQLNQQLVQMDRQLFVAQALTAQERMRRQEIVTTADYTDKYGNAAKSAQIAADQRVLSQTQISAQLQQQTDALNAQTSSLNQNLGVDNERQGVAEAFNAALKAGGTYLDAQAAAAAKLNNNIANAAASAGKLADASSGIGFGGAGSGGGTGFGGAPAGTDAWAGTKAGIPAAGQQQLDAWNQIYGPGNFNVRIIGSGQGGFSGGGQSVNTSAFPTDSGTIFQDTQSLLRQAEQGMDAVTLARVQAGVAKIPNAQAIVDQFLAVGNNAANALAQKAAADFLAAYADTSSSSSTTPASLISPLYLSTSGYTGLGFQSTNSIAGHRLTQSNQPSVGGGVGGGTSPYTLPVIASSGPGGRTSSGIYTFHAATGMDWTVPGNGPADSVQVSGMVSPGERMIMIPNGGGVSHLPITMPNSLPVTMPNSPPPQYQGGGGPYRFGARQDNQPQQQQRPINMPITINTMNPKQVSDSRHQISAMMMRSAAAARARM
jgi:hypothetical protein